MTIRHVFTAMSIALAAVSGAAAEEPQARFHYDGDMEIDPEAGRIALDWTITVYEADLEAVTFLLNPALGEPFVGGADIAGVERGEMPAFNGDVGTYTVHLRDRPDAGDHRQITIAYDGVLLPEPMETRINTVDADKVELTVDSFWLPFDRRFSSLVTAGIDITLSGTAASDWVGVGTQDLRPTATGFRVEQTRPALDIAFTLMARSSRVETSAYTIHDTRPETGGGMETLADALEFCTGFLNAMAGDAGPLPRAAVTVNDREEAGYSRGTLIALTDIDGEDPPGLYQFICHELAHYWSRGNAMTVENWLNEGFADAMANMAVREAFGEAAYQARLDTYGEQLAGADGELPPVWTPGAQDRTPYLVMYRKAPLALAQLEADIGRDAFARFMQGYIRDGIATTPDLLDMLERVAGREARVAFQMRLAE
jgi:hypothetical protein